MADPTGLQGTQQPDSGSDEYNALVFTITQVLNGRNTAALVKIISVANAGELAAVGFVDVQPLVNQMDGQGSPVKHGVIHNVPYFRMQGGANAIILDPQVGDIGVAVFTDRDISAVKASRDFANPGSQRKQDMADGLYFGGLLNGVPTQYVQFSAAGVKLHSPVAIMLDAPAIALTGATIALTGTTSTTITTPTFTVNGATVLNGPLSQGVGAGGGAATMLGPIIVTNDVIAAGKSVAHHTHLVTGVGTQTNQPT